MRRRLLENLAIVAVILIILFFSRTSFIGKFVGSSQEEVSKDCEVSHRDYFLCNNSLAFCNSEKELLNLHLSGSVKDLGECRVSEDKLRESLDKLREELFSKSDKIRILEDELKDLGEELSAYKGEVSDYESLVDGVAVSVCCKERVDNPSINSYTISGKKILCVKDEDKSISCP